MVTGDGYGKSLFSCLSLSFSFWGMVAGDGYGKSLGDGYGSGRWLREGRLCFPLFLDISPFGGWLREMVTGSLCFPVFLSVSPFGGWLREMVTGSLWVMVTGDGYGKSLFSIFFLIFLLSGGWLREMVTGSLCFPFFLIFLLAGDGYGMSLFSSAGSCSW